MCNNIFGSAIIRAYSYLLERPSGNLNSAYDRYLNVCMGHALQGKYTIVMVCKEPEGKLKIS